jgi:nitrous oxide reductase accessory protein NosL
MEALKVSAVVFCLLLLPGFFHTEQVVHAHFVEPKKGDVCHTCEMPIGENPSRAAVIMFQDGKHVKFHGAKCMFTYYLNIKRYSKQYRKKNVATLHVTDFNTLERVRAENAHYVIHSSEKGPMGDEPIPFKEIASAEKFTKEHGGIILDYELITPEIINALNNIAPDNSPAGQ